MAFQMNLRGKVTLDGSPFHSTLRGTKQAAAGWASSIKGQLAGAFAAGAIISQMRQVVEYGGKMADLGKRLGISTTELQNLDWAAKQFGGSLEGITSALRVLSKVRDEALGGDEESIKNLANFGVTADKLKSSNLVGLLKEVGSAIKLADVGDEAEGLIQKVLGKGGGELIPLFKEGLIESIAEAERLGVALDESVISELDRIGDQLDTIVAQLRGPVAEAVLFLAKAFNLMMNGLSFGGAAGRGFLKGFSETWTASMKALEQEGSKLNPASALGVGLFSLLRGMRGMGGAAKDEFQKLVEQAGAENAAAIEKAMNAGGAAPGPNRNRGPLGDAIDRLAAGGDDEKSKKVRDLLDTGKVVRGQVESNALGRIGGTLAGGDKGAAEANKLLKSIDGNMRMIRSRMEGAGININPQNLR